MIQKHPHQHCAPTAGERPLHSLIVWYLVLYLLSDLPTVCTVLPCRHSTMSWYSTLVQGVHVARDKSLRATWDWVKWRIWLDLTWHAFISCSLYLNGLVCTSDSDLWRSTTLRSVTKCYHVLLIVARHKLYSAKVRGILVARRSTWYILFIYHQALQHLESRARRTTLQTYFDLFFYTVLPCRMWLYVAWEYRGSGSSALLVIVCYWENNSIRRSLVSIWSEVMSDRSDMTELGQ